MTPDRDALGPLEAPTKARCSYCDFEQTKLGLMPSAVGGAVCKDWFACQIRHDAIFVRPHRTVRLRVEPPETTETS